MTFIPDKVIGFMQAGVQHLNCTIQTNACSIMGSQTQTQSNILKAGTGFDAKKQFLALIEDAIALPVDILTSISRYQKVLQDASSPLNCVYGRGLNFSPSNIMLAIGNALGYYNLIQVAISDTHFGHNPGINKSESLQTTERKNCATSWD